MYWIYFIQEGEEGPVKIGRALHPHDRLKQLQVGNPTELRLLAACHGYAKDEVSLHKRFSEHRIRSEWFRPATEVLEAAASIGIPKPFKSADFQEKT